MGKRGVKPPEVIERSNGHEWAKWVFKSGSMVCCNICGKVRRADNLNKPCKGPVKIELRVEQLKQEAMSEP